MASPPITDFVCRFASIDRLVQKAVDCSFLSRMGSVNKRELGLVMNFEEQVTSLCAQAIAAEDETKAQQIIEELRTMLHWRIEELRKGLLHSYPLPANLPKGNQKPQPEPFRPPLEDRGGALNHLRTWIKVALALAEERSDQNALQLSQELDSMLRDQEKPA